VRTAVVKTAVTRFAADSLHPDDACALIRAEAAAAIRDLSSAALPQIELPATLTVTFRNADLAEMASWLHGTQRAGRTRVAITGSDPIQLYRTFIHAVLLTRDIAE
jgi:D-amino peptidase